MEEYKKNEGEGGGKVDGVRKGEGKNRRIRRLKRGRGGRVVREGIIIIIIKE
jgi:hypothetical protein